MRYRRCAQCVCPDPVYFSSHWGIDQSRRWGGEKCAGKCAWSIDLLIGTAACAVELIAAIGIPLFFKFNGLALETLKKAPDSIQYSLYAAISLCAELLLVMC